MIITTEDIGRIATEIMHSVNRDNPDLDYREEAEQWASSQGLESEVMPMICNSIRAAHEQALGEALKEQPRDGEPVIVNGEEMLEADPDLLLWAMEITILSAFRWGWESAREYASRTEFPDERNYGEPPNDGEGFR